MSDKTSRSVRKPGAGDPDSRILRSTAALNRAFLSLVHERGFDAITVQHILERAGVSRATFYAHFRNKDDVLYSSYERVFGFLEAVVDQPGPHCPRLFPVAEFLVHVREAADIVRALDGASRRDELRELVAGLAARIVERRLARVPHPRPGGRTVLPRPLLARMLAGALVEMVAWWEAHPDAATPAEMDAAFHRLAHSWAVTVRH